MVVGEFAATKKAKQIKIQVCKICRCIKSYDSVSPFILKSEVWNSCVNTGFQY